MDEAQLYEYRQERHDWAAKALTLGELRSISDDELVERHDALVAMYQLDQHPVMEPGDYLDELQRRAAERQRQTLDRLNARLQVFTLVATAAAVLSVALAAVDLLTR